MKKLLLIALAIMIAGALFAGGNGEEADEVIELLLVDTGTTRWDRAGDFYDDERGDHASFQDKVVADFRDNNPGITLKSRKLRLGSSPLASMTPRAGYILG